MAKCLKPQKYFTICYGNKAIRNKNDCQQKKFFFNKLHENSILTMCDPLKLIRMNKQNAKWKVLWKKKTKKRVFQNTKESKKKSNKDYRICT